MSVGSVPIAPSVGHYYVVHIAIRVYNSRVVSPSSPQINYARSVNRAVHKREACIVVGPVPMMSCDCSERVGCRMQNTLLHQETKIQVSLTDAKSCHRKFKENIRFLELFPDNCTVCLWTRLLRLEIQRRNRIVR